MSDKRILEFETATEAGDTDFVAIDSLAGGTRKIPVTDLPGGGGGGGTTVVPNPVGEPTEELETIKIGSIIYDIPGNGVGTRGLTDEVIYTDTTGQTGTLNITLSNRLDDYDAIYFEYYFPSEATYLASVPSPMVRIVEAPDGAPHKYAVDTYPSYGNRYISLHSSDGGTSATLIASAWSDVNPSVYRIHGIKLGSVGSDSEIIPITGGDGTTSRTFTFPKTPKFIKLYYQDLTLDSGWLVDSNIVWGQAYATTLGHRVFVETANASGGCIALTYPTGDRSVTITAGNAFQACNTVNGTGFMYVDYGGGSGSEGGYSETDLFVNTGSSNPSSIVMNDSIQNYDEIVFKVTRNAYGNTYKLQYRYLTSELELGDQIQCWCWGPNNEYFSYVLTAFDTFSNMAQGNALLCTKIIGIKH